MTKKNSLTFLFFSAFTFLFCLTFFIYYQGVTHYFILDDTPHLQELTSIQKDHSLESYANYILNNPTSHNRRQFSYFSFALQADAWPNAVDFKLVNITLHLINGLLVFLLTCRLLKLQNKHILNVFYN